MESMSFWIHPLHDLLEHAVCADRLARTIDIVVPCPYAISKQRWLQAQSYLQSWKHQSHQCQNSILSKIIQAIDKRSHHQVLLQEIWAIAYFHTTEVGSRSKRIGNHVPLGQMSRLPLMTGKTLEKHHICWYLSKDLCVHVTLIPGLANRKEDYSHPIKCLVHIPSKQSGQSKQ